MVRKEGDARGPGTLGLLSGNGAWTGKGPEKKLELDLPLREDEISPFYHQDAASSMAISTSTIASTSAASYIRRHGQTKP